MGLIDYATKEVTLSGMLDEDSDYSGMAGKAVLDLVKVFAKQGHSGFSAELVLTFFERVARFRPITPITSNPDDWMDVSSYSGKDSPPLWQCQRDYRMFSNDGGKTWWNVDEVKNGEFNQKAKKCKKAKKKKA